VAAGGRFSGCSLTDEISRVLVIEKLSVQDGAVSGEVHNLSSRTVHDVQLFIHHT